MRIKIIYRKGAKPVIVESKEQTIKSIVEDCAFQLSSKYADWRRKSGNPISRQALKRYEIGQKFMLMQKLEEKLR